MTDENVFQGGMNVVRRCGETVHRPAGEHTPIVHRLLTYLHRQGLQGVPVPLGFDEQGNEVLTYVEGDVHESLTPTLRSPELVASAGALLRRMHDASVGFAHTAQDPWMLPARSPAEVICHGDIAPYNSAVRDGRVVGFIDFDTAHPAPRLWDVAYAVYRYAPLHAPNNPDSAGTPAEQAELAATFCRAYGIASNAALLDAVVERLAALIDFMRQRTGAGDANFQQHIAEGHLALYEADIRYLGEQSGEMLRTFASSSANS